MPAKKRDTFTNWRVGVVALTFRFVKLYIYIYFASIPMNQRFCEALSEFYTKNH